MHVCMLMRIYIHYVCIYIRIYNSRCIRIHIYTWKNKKGESQTTARSIIVTHVGFTLCACTKQWVTNSESRTNGCNLTRTRCSRIICVYTYICIYYTYMCICQVTNHHAQVDTNWVRQEKIHTYTCIHAMRHEPQHAIWHELGVTAECKRASPVLAATPRALSVLCALILGVQPPWCKMWGSGDVGSWLCCHVAAPPPLAWNESCHIRMSHVTYGWVMSHMNESCHIWMSHVTFKRVMAHIWMGHVTYKWVMLHMDQSRHVWMSHVTYGWVMSHKNESWRTYEWVMAHINESCHTWMSHGTHFWVLAHMNKSWHTHEWDMAHIWMGHVFPCCCCSSACPGGKFAKNSSLMNLQWKMTIEPTFEKFYLPMSTVICSTCDETRVSDSWLMIYGGWSRDVRESWLIRRVTWETHDSWFMDLWIVMWVTCPYLRHDSCEGVMAHTAWDMRNSWSMIHGVWYEWLALFVALIDTTHVSEWLTSHVMWCGWLMWVSGSWVVYCYISHMILMWVSGLRVIRYDMDDSCEWVVRESCIVTYHIW